MDNKQRKVGNKLILRFLVPYMMILVIPLAIGLITYQKTVEVLKEESIKANIRSLEKSKDMLDSRLKEVDLIVKQLTRNPNIASYQSVVNPFQGSTAYRTLETGNEMYDYRLSNNFIFDYYIFYKNSRMVLSPHLSYRFSEFYDSIYSYKDMTADEWRDVLSNRYYKQYLPSKQMNILEKPRSMVTYIQSLGYSPNPQGAVVVLIDNEEILKQLKGLVTTADGWAYIADQDGRIISHIGESPERIAPIPVQAEPQGLIEGYGTSQNMMITYTTSENNGWTYVVAQPASFVLNKVNYIQKTISTAVAIALLLGILIAFYLAYRNSKPLKSIVNTVLERYEGYPYRSKDTYGLIEGTLSRLMSSNDELIEKVKEQIPIMRRTFLEHLLKGEFVSVEEIGHSLHQVGIRIDGKRYAVIILNLKFPQASSEHRLLEELVETRVLAKEILLNAVNGRGHVHEMDEAHIALLLMNDSGDREKFKEAIGEAAGRITDELSKQLNVQSVAGVGGLYEEIIQISRSYEEARKAVNHYVFQMKNVCIWYDDLTSGDNNYYYPADLETRLINYVKAGEANEVKKLLNQLYQENFLGARLSLPVLRLFLYDVAATIVKLSLHSHKENKAKMDYIESLLSQLESLIDYEHIFSNISQIYVQICNDMNDRKKSHNNAQKLKIIDYVQASYLNPNLNLAMVADLFNLSEVYLSLFFKEQTGVNFSDYLENIRLEKAKELLCGTNLTVNEISLKVGYNTSNTFSRAFKRINGVSAGAYKNANT